MIDPAEPSFDQVESAERRRLQLTPQSLWKKAAHLVVVIGSVA